MKLLAIDTSTERASVALLIGEEMTCEEHGSQKTHAQLLLPAVDRLMTQADLQMNQLDAIVFGCGPGSFTGLRIACSVAKGLGHAHDLPLIPVSTLGAITFALRKREEFAHRPVLAVLDARMQQMYWSYFSKNIWIGEARVNGVTEFHLPEDEPVVLAGVGIDLYWDYFPERIKSQIDTRVTLYPDAAAMIRLALHAGLQPVSAAAAQPVYVRNQVTHGD